MLWEMALKFCVGRIIGLAIEFSETNILRLYGVS